MSEVSTCGNATDRAAASHFFMRHTSDAEKKWKNTDTHHSGNEQKSAVIQARYETHRRIHRP